MLTNRKQIINNIKNGRVYDAPLYAMQKIEAPINKRIPINKIQCNHIVFKIGDEFYKALPMTQYLEIGIKTHSHLQECVKAKRIPLIHIGSHSKQLTCWLVKSKFVDIEDDALLAEKPNKLIQLQIPVQFEIVDSQGDIWNAMLGADFLATFANNWRFDKWHRRTEKALTDFKEILILCFNQRRVICWR